ncbi:MAG: hypothetical protein AAF236_08530 [Verrucomicrobiota bacterium]
MDTRSLEELFVIGVGVMFLVWACANLGFILYSARGVPRLLQRNYFLAFMNWRMFSVEESHNPCAGVFELQSCSDSTGEWQCRASSRVRWRFLNVFWAPHLMLTQPIQRNGLALLKLVRDLGIGVDAIEEKIYARYFRVVAESMRSQDDKTTDRWRVMFLPEVGRRETGDVIYEFSLPS